MMTLRSLSLSPGKTGAISCDVPASTTEAMCCYCGCDIGKGLDSFSGVEAPACVLCALVQTLVRPRIDEEACIVWVPELSQPAMNVMIRRLHLTLRAHKERVETDAKPTKAVGIIPSLYHAAQALLYRRREATARLGTSTPSELADALLRLPAESYNSRDRLLGGTRLLSLGKLFDGTSDIYPEIVDSWAANRRSDRN
jgi:intracellular multiplication protein IcmJ